MTAVRSLAPSFHAPPIMSASKTSDAPRPIFPIYQMMDDWAAFAYSTTEVKPQHHALYFALLTLVKNKGGRTRFALDYNVGMEASSIGSRSTYIAALRALQTWKFITYTPGSNGYKQAIIDVHFLASTEHLLNIYRSSTDTSTDTSTGHINKDLLLTTSNESETGAVASLARAEKKNGELANELAEALADVAALKAELRAGLPAAEKLPAEGPAAWASHTGGAAKISASATTPEPEPPRQLVLAPLDEADPQQAARGGYAPAHLPDDDPAKWAARPRDAQMVADYLRATAHPQAANAHLFFDYYDSVGWLIGRNRMPCQNWKSLLKSFRFDNPAAQAATSSPSHATASSTTRPTSRPGAASQVSQREAAISDALALLEAGADGADYS